MISHPRRRATLFTTAATVSVLSAVALTPASAQPANPVLVSNAANSVRCQLITDEHGQTFTLCVSDIARQSQPECNPPAELIPAVKIEPGYAGTSCWNQGFGIAPTPLQPLQFRSHGTAVVTAGFGGDQYVFDFARLALIRAGATNTVFFALR